MWNNAHKLTHTQSRPHIARAYFINSSSLQSPFPATNSLFQRSQCERPGESECLFSEIYITVFIRHVMPFRGSSLKRGEEGAFCDRRQANPSVSFWGQPTRTPSTATGQQSQSFLHMWASTAATFSNILDGAVWNWVHKIRTLWPWTGFCERWKCTMERQCWIMLQIYFLWFFNALKWLLNQKEKYLFSDKFSFP